MYMKNKLQKHHKSKAFFYVRNLSFVFIGLIGVGLSIAIPTYLSSIKEQQIAAKAQAEEVVEDDSEVQTAVESLAQYK